MRVSWLLLCATILAGCAQNNRAVTPPIGMTTRANVDLAHDFLDLTFQLETGQNLSRLLKYDGPVRVALDPALAAYRDDLAAVLGRIRRGAHIDIAPGGAESQIVVLAVPASELRSFVPGAACFVAPSVQSWAAFRAAPHTRWSTLQRLDHAAIFIPDDAAPYSVRACLNEEIGQALGPVNDLYRLPDSVFNDDNIHLELTEFDLMMLRVLYSNDLPAGAGRDEVAALLPGILARYNPRGRDLPSQPSGAEPAGWKRALETALNASLSNRMRANAARSALSLARQISPQDHRLALSLMLVGRVEMATDRLVAQRLFAQAHAISLAQLGAADLRSAQTAYHLAATQLADAPDQALALVAQFLPVAARFGDAPLESGLLAIRAIAYVRLGRMADAERARQDSLERALFAFGQNVDLEDPVLSYRAEAELN